MFPNLYSDVVPTLFLSISCLILLLQGWLPAHGERAKKIAVLSLLSSIVSAIWLNKVEIWSVIPLGFLFATASLSRQASSTFIRYCMSIFTLILAFVIASHALPGFHSLPWFSNITFSDGANPFTLEGHFDKPWAGIILMLAYSPLSPGIKTPQRAFIWALAASTLMIVIGIIAAVPVEPKWQPAIAVFLLHNLFFTCIAEEVFFRLLLQQPLHQAFDRFRYGNALAIITVSTLFLAVHFHPGISLNSLALIGIGGTLYAVIYHVTRAAQSAILTHFLTNALHIILLRYPLS